MTLLSDEDPFAFQVMYDDDDDSFNSGLHNDNVGADLLDTLGG